MWILYLIAAILIYSYFSGKSQSNRKEKVTYTDINNQKTTEIMQPRKPKKILQLEIPEIDHTPEIDNILDKFENSSGNIFLTGKAGTGKSTLLRYFIATTKKRFAVVAPTGIAAINVSGQTVHSFFSFRPDITLNSVRYLSAEKLNIVRNLDTLIIDEISMVRADLLDCIDKSLRMNRRKNAPFGGVQIIVVGDPFQLPPVVKNSEKAYFQKAYESPHFFSAQSYRDGNFKKFELTKVHRQKDPEFVNILNAIRSGEYTQDLIDTLNIKTTDKEPFLEATRVVTTNALAKMINDEELKKLSGAEKVYSGIVSGNFNEKDMPTEKELLLKEGELIMLLNNDKDHLWVNGTTAKIISLGPNSIKVKFLDDDTYANVELNEWDNIKFIYNEEDKKIEPEIVGKFIQLPVKPAWAITVHKSQGQTYNSAHIDFGSGTFAPGQAYVALSRCRSLEKLTLATPLLSSDIIVDESVQHFMGIFSKNRQIKIIKESEKYEATNKSIIDNNFETKNPANVSKSDINKLKFFMQYPEKYTSGSEKALKKVKQAKKTFESINNTLDENEIRKFYKAIDKYNLRLKHN